jgi:hypothetical protein
MAVLRAELPEAVDPDEASLEVPLEIHASACEGFPPEKVRAVLENARTLGFSQYSFDDQ